MYTQNIIGNQVIYSRQASYPVSHRDQILHSTTPTSCFYNNKSDTRLHELTPAQSGPSTVFVRNQNNNIMHRVPAVDIHDAPLNRPITKLLEPFRPISRSMGSRSRPIIHKIYHWPLKSALSDPLAPEHSNKPILHSGSQRNVVYSIWRGLPLF